MLSTRTILIVDDEPRTRQGLHRTLESWGNGRFSIHTASNGKEAIDFMQQEKVHILLSDIRMPEMMGLELLRKLKELQLTPIIILMSAYSEFEYAQEALRLGAIDYLLKPISKGDLIKAVEEAVTQLDKKERAGVIEKVVDSRLAHVDIQTSSNPAPIREALVYIQQNLQNEITQKEVAQKVHLNPSYLSVLFKDHVKMNFSEYVMRQRIQRAKELLLSTERSINEIAEESGYKTTKYFIKIFKEFEGVTPSAYRKNNK